jgi:hypothetical protein
MTKQLPSNTEEEIKEQQLLSSFSLVQVSPAVANQGFEAVRLRVLCSGCGSDGIGRLSGHAHKEITRLLSVLSLS